MREISNNTDTDNLFDTIKILITYDKISLITEGQSKNNLMRNNGNNLLINQNKNSYMKRSMGISDNTDTDRRVESNQKGENLSPDTVPLPHRLPLTSAHTTTNQPVCVSIGLILTAEAATGKPERTAAHRRARYGEKSLQKMIHSGKEKMGKSGQDADANFTSTFDPPLLQISTKHRSSIPSRFSSKFCT